MMRGLRLVMALLCLVGLVVLVACGGSPATPSAKALEPAKGSAAAPAVAPAAAPAPAPAAPKPLTKVKVGMVSWKGDAGFLKMADEKGFFRQQGLEVEYVLNDSATTLAKALVAGEVDLVEGTPGSAFSLMAGGVNLKVIGGFLTRTPHYFFAKKEIKSIQDLKGKKVSIGASIGHSQDVWNTMMLRTVGLKPDDVTRVPTGGSAASYQALKTGVVDATAGPLEVLPEVQSSPNFHALFSIGEAVPEWVRFSIFTRDDVIQKKPEMLTGYMVASAQGIRYALENRDETLALAAKVTGQKKDDSGLALVYDTHLKLKLVNPNGEISAQRINAMQEMNIIAGGQKSVMPLERVANFDFQKAIVKQLGPYKGEWLP